MPKPAPDVAAKLESQIAEHRAVADGVAAGLEVMRGGPSPWASEEDMAADIAALLEASPEFVAALRRKRRDRGQSEQQQDATRVLVMLYGPNIPDSIPSQTILPNKELCRTVRPHLRLRMSNKTIRRVAGRK